MRGAEMRRAPVHDDAEDEDDQDGWRDDEEPHCVRPLRDLGQDLGKSRPQQEVPQALEAQGEREHIDECDKGEED